MTMRALSVIPGQADSLSLEEAPEPPVSDGEVLVDMVAMGLCGTDLEIVEGGHGKAPEGQQRLILGHESVGRVAQAPIGAGFAVGDWVVGIVRRPDPVPCANCAVGEWDMCRNGRYTERGIVGRHGFGSDHYRSSPEFLVRIDPKLAQLGVLMEPTSVVAKAWEQSLRIGQRARFEARRVLVIGAGPIGLLAALLGVERGLEVHVLDRVQQGPKPDLVRSLGATYHSGTVAEAGTAFDLVFECTGAPKLFFDAIHVAAPDGIVCLAGVSSGGHNVCIDAGMVNREMVLENNVVFGSVNANRRHFEAAAAALAKADPDWLSRLITRRVPVAEFAAAFQRQPEDVKTILTFE